MSQYYQKQWDPGWIVLHQKGPGGDTAGFVKQSISLLQTLESTKRSEKFKAQTIKFLKFKEKGIAKVTLNWYFGVSGKNTKRICHCTV